MGISSTSYEVELVPFDYADAASLKELNIGFFLQCI